MAGLQIAWFGELMREPEKNYFPTPTTTKLDYGVPDNIKFTTFQVSKHHTYTCRTAYLFIHLVSLLVVEVKTKVKVPKKVLEYAGKKTGSKSKWDNFLSVKSQVIVMLHGWSFGAKERKKKGVECSTMLIYNLQRFDISSYSQFYEHT